MGKSDLLHALQYRAIDTSQLLFIHRFSAGSGLCELYRLSDDRL